MENGEVTTRPLYQWVVADRVTQPQDQRCRLAIKTHASTRHMSNRHAWIRWHGKQSSLCLRWHRSASCSSSTLTSRTVVSRLN
eukprot:scaffold90145_cov35-Tisochrysis_lutea.AAC.2